MSRMHSYGAWNDIGENHPLFYGMQSHAALGPLPTKEWLVPGFFARGEISAIFGEPGASKSLLAIDLACRMETVTGWRDEPPDAGARVLYIAAERYDQVRRRADAFRIEHGTDRLRDLILWKGALDLSEPSDDLAALIYGSSLFTSDNEPADIVFIDTISAAMSRPDSDTGATAVVVRNITFAARETGAHICFLHHPPLNGEKRLRGGHLTGMADVTVLVTRKGDLSTAQVTKDNDAADSKRPVLYYRIKSVDVPDEKGDLISAPVVIPVPPPETATTSIEGGRPKVLRGKAAAIEALRQAIDGASGPVSADQWREAFDRLPTNKGKSRSALKAGFFRGRRQLLENQHVVENDGLFSLLP